MRRIEGSPVGGINESMQKGKYIKGVSILKAPNIALVREADKKDLYRSYQLDNKRLLEGVIRKTGSPVIVCQLLEMI